MPQQGTGARSLLTVAHAEAVARGVRGALMHHATDPPPVAISGHMPDGRPVERAHIAFVPLADVGRPEATGALAGVAIVLPRMLDVLELQATLLAAHRWQERGLKLTLGRFGAHSLERADNATDLGPLDPASWCGPARRWATVTPIALDRNPGDLFTRNPAAAQQVARRAEDTIADACTHIGLSRPAVRLLHTPTFASVPSAATFAPYPRYGHGLRRVCVHATLHFADPVTGPILLGAGRYFGIGLCRPCEREAASR